MYTNSIKSQLNVDCFVSFSFFIQAVKSDSPLQHLKKKFQDSPGQDQKVIKYKLGAWQTDVF